MKKFISVLILTLLALRAPAATININADGTGDYPTIQAAIEAANPNDEIVLADGIYTNLGNRDIDPNGKNVIIRSQNGPANCIIDCNGSALENHRGFYFHNGEDGHFIIDGLTIKNGYAVEGGAILCNQSNPIITNCVFINNIADSNEYGGGAICNISCTPKIFNCSFSNNTTYKGCGGAVCNYGNLGEALITNCTFAENIATGQAGSYGGGLYNLQTSGNLTVQDCSFTNNSATDANDEGCGGGMCVVFGSVKVTNCTFLENESDMLGGGMLCISDPNGPVVTNCKFISNKSGGGGGIGNIDSSPIVAHCSFIGNSGCGELYYSGGGILNWGGGSSEIRNCTLAGNKAYYKYTTYQVRFEGTPQEYIKIDNHFDAKTGFGSGICNYMLNSNTSNCIFYNNNNPDGNEIALLGLGTAELAYNNMDYNYMNTGPAHTMNWGAGNINVDPCFVDYGHWDPNTQNSFKPDDVWVAGDYHLTEQSLCINAGDPNYVPGPNDNDLDGIRLLQVYGGRIDMGAYEYPINTQPVAVAGPNQTAYACIDGFADVTLDGSCSYDDNGDILDYFWSWSVNGNLCEANGVNPCIKLPAGQHQIELIVDDGWDESEPSYCTINVVEPLKVSVFCSPRILYATGWDRYIIAFITMPKGITPADINKNEPLLFLPGNVESKRPFIWQSGYGQHRRTNIIVFFDKSDCMENLSKGINKIKIAGRLKSGQCFYGNDFLYVMPTRPWLWFWGIHK